MEQPTDEQKKEFWEWCGIVHIPEQDLGEYHGRWHEVYQYPDGHYLDVLPLIDLNNLFKYAVPKLYAYCLQSFNDGHKNCHATIVLHPYTSLRDMKTYGATVSREEDPALALFWAIWQVIKGGN